MLFAVAWAQRASSTGVTEGTLARLCEPWAHLYGNSKLLATAITFGHVASLLMAGGLAIATDRATLRALRREAAKRSQHLEELSGVHRFVVGGIALSLVTGMLLFASDVDSFVGSWVFWLKMGLIGLLLANGVAMTRAERVLRADAAEASPAWSRLRHAAVLSTLLWYTITLAGVALVNIS